MNKFKKLAVAAVSVVMAGTMAISFAACGKKGGGGGGGGGATGGNINEIKDLYGVLKDDGYSLDYDVYKDRSATPTDLNVAIGYKDSDVVKTSISFKAIAKPSGIKLPDGNTYVDGNLKPAWKQMGEDLNIKWNDVWTGAEASKNLNGMITQNKYASTDVFTTDLTSAVNLSSQKQNPVNILNLAEYLDYMPNFKIFLRDNPVVYLSLLQAGMNTTTGAGQKILVAPYFDGYDTIEKYCIVRVDWAKKLLNGDTASTSTATYASECADTTYASSFMGNTNYTVDALTEDGSATQKITKDYAAVLAAVKGDTPLATAYKAIHSAGYGGNSGNIVDIMNAALAANKDASGAQLLNLFRAYIDVAFVKEGGGAAYSSDKRANLFAGYDAAWDVDDLVAMLRCVKTNASYLGVSLIGGIAPREGNNERASDVVALACQLYGVRGGASRYENTYITKDGELKDARNEVQFYEAMNKMNKLRQEKLLPDYSDYGFKTNSGIGVNGYQGQYFMVYDYSQTQTLAGFMAENRGTVTTLPEFDADVPIGYDFEPIITPISKWDVNGDSSYTADEYFRFSESWRSVKTSGLAINGAIKDNKQKLDAALQFIDYLYSEDGQIVSTFGPQASAAAGTGGFWYNEEAPAGYTGTDVFHYKGKTYKGVQYDKVYTPKITNALYDSFKQGTFGGVGAFSDARLNFTNYARYLIGSTLPLGVKNQSFENQLTSVMGKDGTLRVGQAIKLDVVKGLTLKLSDASNSWFTCVPTGLPLTTIQNNALNDDNAQAQFKYLTGTPKDDQDFTSLMSYIILFGPSSSNYNEQGVKFSYSSIEDILSNNAIVTGDSTLADLVFTRELYNNQAWGTAKKYWTYLNGQIVAE